jgi:lipoprotein-releasing system permease protein
VIVAGTVGLAWRNLGRNRRRTLITGLALAVGTSLCVAGYGLTDGMNADIVHALTRLDLGHVQVHDPEFPRQHTLKHVVRQHDRVIAIARSLSGVEGVAPRVYAYGLASKEQTSAGVQLVGVDPAVEPSVTELDRTLVSGTYLATVPTPWPEGRRLTAAEQKEDQRITAAAEAEALAEIESLGKEPAASRPVILPAAASRPASGREAARGWTRTLARAIDPPPTRPPRVLIGASLARILKVNVGDHLHVASTTPDGMSAEVELEAAGVFRTGTDLYDRNRIYLNLADLQRLVHLDHDVHEVAIRAGAAARASTLAAALRGRLGPGLLVRSWSEIRPDIRSIIQVNDVSTGLMTIIIFIVAALGVVNTMLMAVYERTREIGMLKAIGMSGARILWLVVLETTLLTLVASVAGLGLGLLIDLYLAARGVDLTFITKGVSVGGMGMSTTIHGVITAKGLLFPVAILAAVCFAAAFYPAVRAARMRPAQGMREV